MNWRRQTDRSRDDLAAAAVNDLVSLGDWQTGKIAAGLAAAERGDFASDDEVAAVPDRYRVGM